MRFGHVHGAGPLARDQARDVALALGIVAVLADQLDPALGQHGCERERHVRRGEDLVHRRSEEARETATAVDRISCDAPPSRGNILLVRLLPTGCRGHAAGGGVEPRALDVASLVERRDHLDAEARELLQEPEHGVEVGVLVPGQRLERRRVEQVLEDESDVVERGLVGSHLTRCAGTFRRRRTACR